MTQTNGAPTGRHELIVPPEAASDPTSREMLRAWAAGGSLHISERAASWPDPAAWGMMLADIAGHVANYCDQAGIGSRADVLTAIRDAIIARLGLPATYRGLAPWTPTKGLGGGFAGVLRNLGRSSPPAPREQPGPLPLPAAALADTDARELVRVWQSRGDQYVSMQAGAWEDPRTWAEPINDLATMLARAYARSTTVTESTALARIKEGLAAELLKPTDEPRGRTV